MNSREKPPIVLGQTSALAQLSSWFYARRYQAEQINKRRADAARELDYHRWKKNGAMIHVGNPVEAGQDRPGHGATRPESAVDLKCFLDGRDDYWVTSTTVGALDHDGKYHWMP